MAVCTHCGRASQGYERFCMSCGQPLDSGAAQLVAAVSSGNPVWQRTSSESSLGAGGPDSPSGPAAGNAARQETPDTASPQSRLVVHRLASADGGSEDGPSIEVGEFILDGRDIAIGRAPSCDIVLEGDQLASRRHALLRNRSEGYTVVDLGSSNGTYINDLEIREAVLLHEGDHISIGGHELVYSTSPASPHASLAGVKLAEPEASPMVDTDPNAVAVSARDTAVSPAVSDAFVAPAGTPAAPVWSLPEAGVAMGAAVAGMNGGGASVSSSVPGAGQEARREEGERASVAASGSPAPAKPEPDFAASSITDADFEALRVQLAAVSEALARKATAETRIIKQLRGALASARDQLAVLAAQTSAESESAPATNVEELINIARQAAENSRHLDYLTALAEHAGEIANALESNPSGTSGIPASVLQALRAQLDEALS